MQHRRRQFLDHLVVKTRQSPEILSGFVTRDDIPKPVGVLSRLDLAAAKNLLLHLVDVSLRRRRVFQRIEQRKRRLDKRLDILRR